MMNGHTCTQHQPGAAACYTSHACRCDACRRAAGRQKKRSRAGLTGLIDAKPAATHARHLHAAGWTWSAISASAGLSYSHVHYTVTLARRVHHSVAAAILSVKLPTAGLVDATGTHRRIRALGAIGWTTRDLSPIAGLGRGTVGQILRRPHVSAQTATKITAAYNLLWDTPGPSTLTRQRSTQHPPPLAWDDGHGPHGIDNPRATPASTWSPE